MKKRFKTIAFVCLATMAVVSCDENNDNPIPSGETFDLGDGSNAYEISSNMTLTYPNTYNLKGFVYVTEGATLTIEPGVVIKGEKESKATLIVERGGKLIAEGTSERPIVFTSAQAPGKPVTGAVLFFWVKPKTTWESRLSKAVSEVNMEVTTIPITLVY